MATFDQLSAEQRAIIELVLKQGQSYDELGEMLGMPTSRVRELARDALVRLSPVSAAAVDDDWRGQLGDYLLNQQSGPESTATRGHLRRSEAARGWARSVLDSLEQFYTGDSEIPQIPEGEAAEPRKERRRERKKPAKDPKEPKAAKEPRPARPRRELSPEAQRTVRRRRLIGAGALVAVLLVAVLLWPVGLLTGDDDDDGGSNQSSAAQAPRIVGQLVLRPVDGAAGSRNAGIAVIAERSGQRQLIVQAQLPANKDREAYEVWLYNSKGDARSLGAQVTDRQGTFQGAGPLPRNFERFRFIDVSREKVDQERGHSGTSVLRGRIDQIQAPPQNAGGQGDAPQGGAGQGTAPQGQSTTP